MTFRDFRFPPPDRRHDSLRRGLRCLGIALVLAVLTGLAPAAFAHGALHEQIAELTRRIASAPEQVTLRIQRSDLLRLDGQYAAAARDLEFAAQLDATFEGLEVRRGALALARGDAAAAEVALDRRIAIAAQDGDALLLRARARVALGRPVEAIADYGLALARLARPTPEMYLEAANVAVAAGDPDAALAQLDAAVARLGTAPALEDLAITIERGRGRNAEALARELHLAWGNAGTMARLRPVAVRPDAPLPGGGASTLAVLSRGPYLQRATPNAMTVRWRTAAAAGTRVRWGSDPAQLTNVVDVPGSVTEHEATVSGLAPATRYYYSVGTTTETLAGGDSSFHFTTLPVPGAATPTRVWAIGDAGTKTAAQRSVRDAYYGWTGTRATDVWLMLGDNAYSAGTDAEYQAALFDVYPTMLRNTVAWPTRGNHDVLYAGANNDYYDVFTLPTAGESGGLPSANEAYYSFDRANVHFICLDSEGSGLTPGSAMAVWLRADLAMTHADWVIAFWHHPPYTEGSHNSDDPLDSGGRMRDVRGSILPILDSTGVDLVLTGHSHSYERSMLLDHHYGLSSTLHDSMKVDAGDGRPGGGGAYEKPTPTQGPFEGAVYVVAGSSGQVSGGTLNHPVMITSLNVLGSLVLDVDGHRLDARFLDAAGALRDSFTVLKGGLVTVDGGPLLGALALASPSPNPNAGPQRLNLTLPRAGHARLSIYGVDGRRVATLFDGIRPAGRQEITWAGADDHGLRVPAGVYFAVLDYAGEKRAARVVRLR